MVAAVVGVLVLAIGRMFATGGTPVSEWFIGAATLAAASLATGVSVRMLARWLLRPFRDLAHQVDADRPLTLSTFLHSDVDEVVSMAVAIQRTESRLTSSTAQIQRDRSDMAALFEYLADGVLVLDAQDRVEMANPAAARLLRQAFLEGRPLPLAVRDSDILEVVRAARGAGPIKHSVELRVPDGGQTWLQVIATRLPTEDRTLVLLQDVTELRHAESVRRDFVANVSHELKTPVASLKALVETLEAGALHDPDCGPDFLRRMHVEADGLAQLVAELLQLTRIEAGRLDLDLRACRAQELIDDAVDRIRPYAARVGLNVHVECIEADLWLRADPRQISQVLSNLLSNAVKFTPPGGHVQLGAPRDCAFVELWVSDSGVGIARPDLVRVFERFYKTDPSRTSSGTGLGLAICKHVIQAHGGCISAESDGPGRGATLRFTLPLAASQDASAGEREPDTSGSIVCKAFKRG